MVHRPFAHLPGPGHRGEVATWRRRALGSNAGSTAPERCLRHSQPQAWALLLLARDSSFPRVCICDTGEGPQGWFVEESQTCGWCAQSGNPVLCLESAVVNERTQLRYSLGEGPSASVQSLAACLQCGL